MMSFKGAKFGFGPKELGGSVDLINHYRLGSHHEFFCKRSLPMPISKTHYLRNVVGNREIRKGDGMELDQLTENLALLEKKKEHIHPIGLDVLADGFQMHETAAARRSTPDRGTPAAAIKSETKSKDRHSKKIKLKHKHTTNDKNDPSNENKGKDDNEAKDMKRGGSLMNGQDSVKRQDKKRKQNNDSEFQPRAQRHQPTR